jgi:hypothetical protein
VAVRSACLTAAVVILMALSGAEGRSSEQPIAFNHRLHIHNGVPCTVCHAGARTGLEAGLPGVTTCRRCHEDVLYESPEEAKIRTTYEKEQDLRWHPLTHLQPYVYFSHNRHVTLGERECETCHGDVASWTAPPRTVAMRFWGRPGMANCIRCHESSHSPYAGVDCLNCHH